MKIQLTDVSQFTVILKMFKKTPGIKIIILRKPGELIQFQKCLSFFPEVVKDTFSDRFEL